MWFRKKFWYLLFYRLLIFIFIVTLAVGFLLTVFLPKPTVSETEKRTLATLPPLTAASWFDGTFADGFEAYIADTFPYRDKLVTLSAAMETWKGIRPDGVRIIDAPPPILQEEPPATTAATTLATTAATTPAATTASAAASTAPTTTAATTAATTATTVATTAAPPEEDFPIEQRGAILIYKDTAFEIFGGTDASAERYASVITEYTKAMPDVSIYNMVVPSSAGVNLPEKYKRYSGDQQANIAHLYASLGDDVISVNAYDAIRAHKDEYVYFATDHHWTGLGAYYAYTAFAESAGFAPTAYADYEKATISPFRGTLYAASGDAKLKEDYVEYCLVPTNYDAWRYTKKEPNTPVYTTVLAPYAKGSDAYGVYLHGDFPRIDIKNLDNPDQKSIIVIKESYGNAFVPYLIPHYANVYVIDLRYFSGNITAFAAEHDVDEILILNNAFAANTKHYSDRLLTMLTK